MAPPTDNNHKKAPKWQKAKADVNHDGEIDTAGSQYGSRL